MRFSPFKVSVAILTITVATLGGGLAASATQQPAPAPPRSCVTPSASAGTTITVDSDGVATAPAQPGRLDYRCTDGRWIRITIPAAGVYCPTEDSCAYHYAHHRGTVIRVHGRAAARPALPAWLHTRSIPGACGRGHAGVMLWTTAGDQTVVICKSGDIRPS